MMVPEDEFEEVTIESATHDSRWRVSPALLKSVKLQVVHIRAKNQDVRLGRQSLSNAPTLADKLWPALMPDMKYVHMCYEIPERPGSFIICGSNRAYITDSIPVKLLRTIDRVWRIVTYTDFKDTFLLKKFESQTFIFTQIWGDMTIVLNRTGSIRAFYKQQGKAKHKHNLLTTIDAPCQVVTTPGKMFVKLGDGAREVELRPSGFVTTDIVIADSVSDFVYDQREQALYFLGRQSGSIYRQETKNWLELQPRIRKNSAFHKLKISYSGNLIAAQKFSTKLSLHLVEKPELKQLHSACFEDQGAGEVEGFRLLCPRRKFYLFMVQIGIVLSLFAEHKHRIFYVDKVKNEQAIHSLAYHKSGYWIGIGTSRSFHQPINW